MPIKEWLLQKIAEETDLPSNEISCDEAFENFEMDSLSLLSLSFDLEEYANLEEIDPSVFTEYNTINKLTSWLNQQK